METSPATYARESSHKSNAIAPKRQRGRERVARILDAAGAVFAEKGVDGTTMTEIAARSGTAIGSLYRFFPTKESIAATLLERFIHDRLAVLDQLCETVQPGAGEELARALLDVWLDKREERDYTTLLLAARPDAEHHTAQWRAQFQGRVVRILEKAEPGAQASAAARGVVLLHLLKLAPQLVRSEADTDVRTEMEKLVLGLVNAA
ncbi:TetR/AcrR family transcriptional regulator [Asaia sp. As-1742]|uniref:TetR/AcrR family transcriptional regulator n=1 Tax=Asaia sp. As-1742 TaxID=2608325 RepID=UPI00142323A7|nr:TetR/AcrR family transcriptional regulator [Asaia sp. As-1742]NIE80541.1 TetR/AcrR family transcriptional regulator [Asaia sp. As-1742]